VQRVLIIGAGAREHALAWKLLRSRELGRLYVAPGNGGTEAIADNVPIKPTDIRGLLDFATAQGIDLTIVGPDDALALGVVDAFRSAGLRAYGPTRAAARVETSKVFGKKLMASRCIPTARYETFTDLDSATQYVKAQAFPLVVKASGPAYGRGSYIAQDLPEATRALEQIMAERIYGEAGSSVLIEEHLTGQEVSVHAFCDGRQAVLFPPAQDHKRIGTGDTGPNTGGMGAYAPVPWAGQDLMGNVRDRVVDPVMAELAAQGAPFTGTLYPGLMVSGQETKVLEFNARFGDPETQCYLPLLDSDLLGILTACAGGGLLRDEVRWNTKTALTVVLASDGYPGRYQTGLPIAGVAEAEALPDIFIFHAGTRRVGGRLLTSGGRVLDVTAVAGNLADAQRKAYAAVRLISFEGMQYRTDIGDKALLTGSAGTAAR
jgi:phosphoribosylamine---glycine ligase